MVKIKGVSRSGRPVDAADLEVKWALNKCTLPGLKLMSNDWFVGLLVVVKSETNLHTINCGCR